MRNYQARNFLRDGMRSGDGVLIYHSSCAEPGVVGVAHVASPPRPDPTQFDPRSEYHDGASREDAPRWWLVDIAHDRTLTRTIPLAELHRVPIGLPRRRVAGKAGAVLIRFQTLNTLSLASGFVLWRGAKAKA